MRVLGYCSTRLVTQATICHVNLSTSLVHPASWFVQFLRGNHLGCSGICIQTVVFVFVPCLLLALVGLAGCEHSHFCAVSSEAPNVERWMPSLCASWHFHVTQSSPVRNQTLLSPTDLFHQLCMRVCVHGRQLIDCLMPMQCLQNLCLHLWLDVLDATHPLRATHLWSTELPRSGSPYKTDPFWCNCQFYRNDKHTAVLLPLVFLLLIFLKSCLAFTHPFFKMSCVHTSLYVEC